VAATLFSDDVSLTPEGGTRLAAVLVDPPLPLEMSPSTTQTISLTFLDPATPTATLRILSVEYELEGY
jgi:hypothetical protein